MYQFAEGETMKPEDRIAKLEERQRSERTNLEREIQIFQHLPESLTKLDSMVHMHKLYDRIGSIHFKYHRYESIRNGQSDPTTGDIREMLKVFPPVDLAIYRDGCVGVRTLADALAMFDKHDNAQYGPIAPFWFSFNPSSYSEEFCIHYIGQSPIGLLEVETFFPAYGTLARTIGVCVVQRSKDNSRDYEDRVITRDEFVGNDKVRVVSNARQSVIRYSSGDSRKTPGQKLVYYDSADGHVANLTLAEMLDVMDAMVAKEAK